MNLWKRELEENVLRRPIFGLGNESKKKNNYYQILTEKIY